MILIYDKYRVSQKTALKIVWTISPAWKMLDNWHISHLKSGICKCVLSTKTFMYEQRNKQNNIGYQISKIFYNEQSNILKSDNAPIHS